MHLSLVHTLFDLLAALCACAATYAVYRWRLRDNVSVIDDAGLGYAIALLAGAAIGGFGLGTLNLQLSGIPGIGRSVIGALAGAIAGVELFKLARGMRGSTGMIFVPGFAASIVIGRLGCYCAGLDDHTAGVATALPWGHDFGDGIARHPVQLYESLAMLGFLVIAIARLRRRDAFFLRNGFYLLVFWYAAQRFAWEFLKPYAALWGSLNVFHVTALVLMTYSISMMVSARECLGHCPRRDGAMKPPASGMESTLAAAPLRKSAPYLFHGQTTSLCETCLELVPAKIVVDGDDVFYLKRCATHGVQKTLISTDAGYYRRCLDYLKPGDRPLTVQSRTDYGCPYDCGLCPDHEQHSCLALIEVTEHCNLACPVCFADSSPQRLRHRSLDEIARMMDALVESEGEPDLLQLSGGEPTAHPDILRVLEMTKTRPIRHVMLNTNGVRIAREAEFVAELARFKPGFEVYLQFDSLRPEALMNLRGADLTRVRRQALENLERHAISTTLVVVVKRGVNDDELGALIDYALQWKCVRGITFQPIQDAGRNEGFDGKRDRVVLSDIRKRIIAAGTPFSAGDIIPLPCNPESIAIGYALRSGTRIAPITAFFPRDMLVDALPNAITFEKYPQLHRQVLEFFSLATSECNNAQKLEALLCCLPQIPMPQGLGYENVFRVAIVEFLDRYNFCLSRVKRSCIHFVTPAGQIVPFDTYNLFYRDGLIDAIRARRDRARRG